MSLPQINGIRVSQPCTEPMTRLLPRRNPSRQKSLASASHGRGADQSPRVFLETWHAVWRAMKDSRRILRGIATVSPERLLMAQGGISPNVRIRAVGRRSRLRLTQPPTGRDLPIVIGNPAAGQNQQVTSRGSSPTARTVSEGFKQQG
jgi:hypothetical protein